MAGDFSRRRVHGDEIEWRTGEGKGQMTITRFNLVSGQARTNIIGELSKASAAQTTSPWAKGVACKTNRTLTAESSVARKAPGDTTKKLDPQKLALQLSDAPYAAKVAAPATIATTLNKERTLAEIPSQDEDPTARPSANAGSDLADHFAFIATRIGFIQFSRRLIEEKFISHSAMNAPPKYLSF